MAKVEKSPDKKRSTQRGKISMGNVYKVLVVVSVLLFIGSGIAWWQVVRNDPENTFSKMLENNLRTSSVTRTVTQGSQTQKLEQIMRVQNRTDHKSSGTTKITQGVGGSTVVVTDNIGLPSSDYTRYTSIVTDEKGQKGQDLNFDKVINVWAVSEVPSESQLGSVYQDTVFGGLFMFADLPADKRSSFLDFIRDNKVYEVDYDSVKKTSQSGRPKYTYTVSISPTAYISMIKEFGNVIGLTQLDELDPKNYENAEPLSFSVSVDVISQRLDTAKNLSGGAEQNYGGYGIIENVELPKDPIPADELQKLFTQSASV